MPDHNPTLVVIGGGAAGFFCAVNAARLHPGLRVIILEKTGKVLQKVKVSGGGRCNVTHQPMSVAEFSKHYPRGAQFLKKTLHHFSSRDTIDWFEARGVKLKTEDDGRMFPVSDSSQTIIDCLLREATRYHVELRLHAGVTHIQSSGKGFQIGLQDQSTIYATYICIATGGFPKVEQFDWLIRSTGHTVAPPVPSLFTFNAPKHPLTQLMGIASRVKLKISGTRIATEGPLLITHWGVSGPAVLRASAFGARVLAEKNYHFTAVINWLPEYNENSLREKVLAWRMEKGKSHVDNTEWFGLPRRLAGHILEHSGIPDDMRWADVPALHQNRLIKSLTGYELPVNGKTTFKEEFVTAGGVDLSEIDPNTMQSKICPGLFFAGEIIDVDGITGGFNFQHAWTSAMVAASSIARM